MRIIEFLKKVRFIYKPYAKIKIAIVVKKRNRLLHKNGYLIMNKLTDTIVENKVKAFCAFGTLLGFIRDKGFIKHDEDIDFGVINDANFSWEKLESILTAIGMKKTREFTFDDKITEQSYIENGVNVDFFLYTPINNKMMAHIYYKKAGVKYKSENEYSAKESWSPLVDKIDITMINDTKILIPSENEVYLSSVYGESWRVPDPDFQHDSKVVLIEDKYAKRTVF